MTARGGGFYERKRGERFIHTQALLALASRLVDVLWALCATDANSPSMLRLRRCRGLTRSLRVLVSLDDANIVIGSDAQHLSLSVRFVNRQSAQMPDDNNGPYCSSGREGRHYDDYGGC